MANKVISIKLKEFSKIIKGHGRVVDESAARVYSALLAEIKKIPLGEDERVILDCSDVHIITPGLLSAIATQLEYEETSERTLCYHRSLVIVNPNADTKILLTWIFKGLTCSLLMGYTHSQKHRQVIREDILNLPHFLQETLNVIKEHGSLSSRALIELFKGKKPTAIRERLRQLFIRGLVQRQAQGTVEGERFFIYQPFTLLGLKI